ncbi:MAG: preprotein translocase subunit SecG [Saccharofermentans sp.]|jgi:preprotein translocase subunit SecG|nr:preprotein translocase subunit SecG [Clostridiales bacterium]MCR5340932.1 preprotein translocase subunit SecG [Saccharofermentans sp.]
MTGLKIALSIIDIILAVAIIILFLVQEGNDQGMGVVAGGSSESYYGKAKGRTLDEQLKRWTVICSILFAIVSVILYLSVARGW